MISTVCIAYTASILLAATVATLCSSLVPNLPASGSTLRLHCCLAAPHLRPSVSLLSLLSLPSLPLSTARSGPVKRKVFSHRPCHNCHARSDAMSTHDLSNHPNAHRFTSPVGAESGWGRWHVAAAPNARDPSLVSSCIGLQGAQLTSNWDVSNLSAAAPLCGGTISATSWRRARRRSRGTGRRPAT